MRRSAAKELPGQNPSATERTGKAARFSGWVRVLSWALYRRAKRREARALSHSSLPRLILLLCRYKHQRLDCKGRSHRWTEILFENGEANVLDT